MALLLQMVDACPDTLAGLRDKVIAYVQYYTRGRRSEGARYRVGSVELVSDSLMIVRERTSKNDKKDEGREYEIDDPAAVAVARAWREELTKRGQGDPHMPLLRRVNKGDNLDPVSEKTGWGLTPHAINEITKRIAARAELDAAADVTSQGWRSGVPGVAVPEGRPSPGRPEGGREPSGPGHHQPAPAEHRPGACKCRGRQQHHPWRLPLRHPQRNPLTHPPAEEATPPCPTTTSRAPEPATGSGSADRRR